MYLTEVLKGAWGLVTRVMNEVTALIITYNPNQRTTGSRSVADEVVTWVFLLLQLNNTPPSTDLQTTEARNCQISYCWNGRILDALESGRVLSFGSFVDRSGIAPPWEPQTLNPKP